VSSRCTFSAAMSFQMKILHPTIVIWRNKNFAVQNPRQLSSVRLVFDFRFFFSFLSLTFDITDEDEVLEQGGDFIAITMYVHGSFEFPPTPIFFCRVTPCYHLGACNQFADCPCYQKKQRCQRGCRCAKTCKLKTMILNYIPLLKCRRRTALQRLSLLS
jgi:hypothetical protein